MRFVEWVSQLRHWFLTSDVTLGKIVITVQHDRDLLGLYDTLRRELEPVRPYMNGRMAPRVEHGQLQLPIQILGIQFLIISQDLHGEPMPRWLRNYDIALTNTMLERMFPYPPEMPDYGKSG